MNARNKLKRRAEQNGFMLIETDDERGCGWVVYDPAVEREVGPLWKRPGSRLTLDEVERFLAEWETPSPHWIARNN